MVRETRHLWVGNLPENIREDRIREHFKRYGRVQSVKLLPRVSEEKTGEVQMACTVAFMDIKSAAKAHNAELKIDDRTLNTEYYEPVAIPSAASPHPGTPPSYSTSTSPGATRFPNGHGSSDEHGFPDPTGGASNRFYERTSGGVVAAPTSAPEGGSGTCRGGRNRDRFRGGGGHRGTNSVWGTTTAAGYGDTSRYNSTERSQSETTGYSSAPSSESNERRNSDNVRKKAKSRSGSRSPSPNGSTSSRSPSRSRSRSSSSSSSSTTSRGTSSTSSPSRLRRHQRRYKKSAAAAQAAGGTETPLDDSRRPLGICVRNLPVRSSDTSLKDGLFHEYKKHGKVTWVKVVGQNADRHAIVCFKKPEDAEKALEVSYDKLFFGCKIEVAPHSVCDIDEGDCRYESEIDEYNPKATRTLFIGNLEKDVTASDLRKHFDQFGEIIEIDIKKQGAVSSYAFCQYSDIISVVKAIRKMDGEHLGNNRIKLGFGKSMAYNCVWIDGVADTVTEKYLRIQFEPFGSVTKCIVDREKGQGLVFYEHVSQAQLAVSKMRGFVLKSMKLQVDFASRECQECFFERLGKQVGATVLDRAGFEDRTTRTFEVSAPARISRYDTPTRPRTSSYSSRSSVAAMASPGTPGNATPRGGRTRVRFIDYDLEYGTVAAIEASVRHPASHRSYDEYSQGSAASHEEPYDPYEHPVAYLPNSPVHLEPLEVRVVQNLVDVPYAPHDIRNLQKERVHLLEQLEDCPSSGDELISPKKRLKLDLLDPTVGDVIIEANHRDHNRKVMEVRRLSEATLRHHSRRPSMDKCYAPHTVGCKRRKTGGSEAGARTGTHSHYTNHSDGSDQAGSRPGTPLCDENPEFPLGEPPKRTTREREGPMVLPLPKWAAQVRGTPEFQRGTISVAGIKGQKEHTTNPLASPPPAATSPRVSQLHLLPRPPSPSQHVPPPASPPPRPPSLSSNSSDSDGATGSPSLEERIKSLDEKYEKWSGSRSLSAAGNDALAMLDANREKFRLRHKLLEIQDLKEVQPSDIVKSVMAKRSVFDEDLKRLESVGEKYEPKDFGMFSRLTTLTTSQSSGSSTPSSNISSSIAPLTVSATTKLTTSISTQLPKTSTMLSPRSSGTNISIPASRGLQYPFPSHPPMQMSPAPPLPPAPPPPPPPVGAPATTCTAPSQPASLTPPPPPAATTTTTTTSTHINNNTSGVAVRNPNLGENRLKPLGPAPGDSRTPSVKNRSSVVGPVVSDVCSAAIGMKPSEKVTLRRNSSSTSPRADVKTRRNSDTSARRIDDSEIKKSEEQKLADKAKEELEKQRKEQEEKERVERERLEKEKQEKERLERERKEKERLERESELEKQRLEKERLEKEKIAREKAEKERERIRQEKERAARLEKELLEKERLEKERIEKERLEREQQEKEERDRRERELKEKLEKEERERKEKEAKEEEHRQAKSCSDRRKSEDRGSSRTKDPDNHISKHRENHSDSRQRENNTHHHDRQSSTKEIREEKPSSNLDSHRHDSHKGHNLDRDTERRKESVKENRDNNIHEKHKLLIETKDDRERAVVETRHMSLDLDNKSLLNDHSKDGIRRKERNNSLPVNVGLKRRMSSHEILEPIDEAKRIKLQDHNKERRDSKDSSKSDDKKDKPSKHKHKNSSTVNSHNSSKDCEERRREKEKEREERHRHKHKSDKQKSKSKSREKDGKEIRDSPPDTPLSESTHSLNDRDFLAKLNLRSNEDIEREEKQKREQFKEKRPEEAKKLDLERHDKIKREKHPSESKDLKLSPDDKLKQLDLTKKEHVRKSTNSSGSDSDAPKKHSIFDIVDDGPPYISMYDKVKARSCKNMQKQEEEKRQEKIKAKFSQLKLSRARREEKKRSTSWDEDSDSDREAVIVRRNRKVIDSSDESQERKNQNKSLCSDSDGSIHMRSIKTEDITDEDIKLKHQIFKIKSQSKITSDTSDDDYHRRLQSNNKIKSENYLEDKIKTEYFENDTETELDVKPEKITSIKSEIERLVKKERRNSKFQEFTLSEPQSFDIIHTESSEVKMEQKFNCRSLFDNSTEDEIAEMRKEKAEKREKKHKKKQKKQKQSVSSEELNKLETDSVLSDAPEKKHHDRKKEHSKKDKKREKTKEGKDRSKRKKNRSEDKEDLKREGKMENIFGSLSEDSDAGVKEPKSESNVDEIALAPSTYHTESEKEQEKEEREKEEREKEEHKRRKEKKRREKERRLQEAAAAAAEEPPNSNENSMDFADMCKQLEENIKDDASEVDFKPEADLSNLETTDAFAFPDQENKKEKEERKEVKEKKKKRKKSKDEKKHHHHHHHHDKSKSKSADNLKPDKELEQEPQTLEAPVKLSSIPEIKIHTEKEDESITSTAPLTPSSSHNQSLPSLVEISSPVNKISPELLISPSTRDMVPLISPIPKTPTTSKVKREKLIPGFGTDIDEVIHETAVKSISEEIQPIAKTEEPIIKEEGKEELEPTPDKPRVVISQEETEDAVAALLGESFGSTQFEERYSEEVNTTNEEVVPELVEEEIPQDDEEMRKAVQSLEVEGEISKPDTPQSEHDLQIDTDTEEQDDSSQTVDQVPKTPETPIIHSKVTDSPFFSSTEKVATPSPVTYATLTSPPSLTPIKPQSVAVVDAKKNLNLGEIKTVTELPPPPPSIPQKTVIAQTWPKEKVELPSKIDIPIEEKVSASVTSLPVLKPFATSAPVKVSEPSYPPLAKLSPSLEQKCSSPILQPQTVVVQQSRHNLPACSPVAVCKSTTSEGILSPKPSNNVNLNRLPITSVMVSKPIQATTIYLPQAKVAQSSEQPKLVTTAELRQERPRMILQPSGVPPYSAFPTGSPPRVMIPGNIRHLPPSGLLLTTRHINPSANYGQFIARVPHPANFVSLPPKDVPVQSDIIQPQISLSSPQVATSSMSVNAHIPSTANILRVNTQSSGVINMCHSPLNGAHGDALSPSTSLKSPILLPAAQSSPLTSPVIASSSSSVVGRQSPVITQAVSVTATVTTPPTLPESKISKEVTTPKEVSQLALPELRTSTPSPVIVANPEVKSDNIPPPQSPIKLAIEKVTEELNLSLEKKEVSDENKKDETSEAGKDATEPVKNDVTEELKKEEKQVVESLPVEKLEEPKKPDGNFTLNPKLEESKDPEDSMDNKEDNDFWSAKDSVNIDSVIKTLGSADELSDTENKEPEQSSLPSVNNEITESPEKSLSAEEPILSDNKNDEESEAPLEGSVETIEDQKQASGTRSSVRRGGKLGRPRGATQKVTRTNVERAGIQTRRGKLKEAQVTATPNSKRGGRGGAAKSRYERKSSKSDRESDTPSTNDVYEFRDDSDDSNREQRPRLVLTIKSTTSSTSNAQATAIVKEITKDGTKEIGKEHVQVKIKEKESPKEATPKEPEPAKETKEDFTSPQAANTRKSRRLAQKDISKNTIDDTIEDVVKNSPVTRSLANQRRSGRQLKKPQPVELDTPRKSPRGRKPSRRASEAAESSSEDMKDDNSKSVETTVAPSPVLPPSPIKAKSDTPVVDKPKEPEKIAQVEPSIKEKKVDHLSLKTAMLKRFKGEMSANNKPEPTNLIDPVTGMLIPMRESEEGKYIPLPGSSPGDKKPAVAIAATIEVLPNKPTDPIKQPQPSVIAQSHQLNIIQQPAPKVHSLKAHVLSSQAAKAVVSEIAAPLTVHPAVSLVKETIPVIATPPGTVVVAKTTAPVLVSRSGTPVTSAIPTSVNLQTVVGPLSPRPGAPVGTQVKPPVLSPSQQILLNNQKHLLQAREQPLGLQMASKQAQMVNTQMAHMKQVMMATSKAGIVKPPHTIHLSGQIASPPISKAHVSGRIIQVPPQGAAKGIMEPPKIDVNLPNIIMGRSNLSPSGPQARLAGLPVYEASLMIADPRAYYKRNSPPPAHQNSPHSPKGEQISHFSAGPTLPGHYIHPQQHMMYQQFLRQQQQQHFQRSASLEKSGEEGEEAPVGLALSGRGAAVPHHSPHDRTTESPALGQVYNTLSARHPAYHPGTRYFDQQPAEPPPAHRPLTSHDRAGLPPLGAHTASHPSTLLIPDRPTAVIPERPMSAHLAHERAPLGTPDRPQIPYGGERSLPLVGAGLGAAGNLMGAVAKHIGVDAPTAQRGIQAATPPLASQVPPQAESLFMLLKQYPLMWQGLLALKNDQAAVQMYYVSGNDDVAKCSLPKNTDGSTPPLRIFQRMRLEPMQVEGVARKMQMEKEHCMLLALPCGHDHMDVLKQSTNLTYGFITYLQQKQAAGIVNVAAPGTTHPPAYVVHIFPSCDFVNENLRRIAPSLLERVADIAHLLIVITTV
ncbi:protein split ends isoform X2 [Anthonomus grandis grandis]|uniref:protein split ends isoform X2 n=1 Tax=Anthonomus grandis grandis TaxID=2921223 RepID=UPI0021650C59|nr:protein split ends isoform X2 [Anthonomus grandis grandis]